MERRKMWPEKRGFKVLICNQTRSWGIRVLAVPCVCVKKPRRREHCIVWDMGQQGLLYMHLRRSTSTRRGVIVEHQSLASTLYPFFPMYTAVAISIGGQTGVCSMTLGINKHRHLQLWGVEQGALLLARAYVCFSDGRSMALSTVWGPILTALSSQRIGLQIALSVTQASHTPTNRKEERWAGGRPGVCVRSCDTDCSEGNVERPSWV